MTTTPRFYFVWNPAGRTPAHKHDTLESAKNEAARLARTDRGQTFIVLQSICEATLADVAWVDHDDIPF